MRLKTVAVEYERKLNLGDFNSVRVACSLWAEMENDDESVVMHQLWMMAKANVKAQLAGAMAKGPQPNLTVENTFLGVPIIQIKVETGNEDEPVQIT